MLKHSLIPSRGGGRHLEGGNPIGVMEGTPAFCEDLKLLNEPRKNTNPEVKCAVCLYLVGYGIKSISFNLYGTNRFKYRVKGWIERSRPPKRQSRNGNRRYPHTKCACCLSAIGFGVNRITRMLYGEFDKRLRGRIAKWIKVKRANRPHDASACYHRLLLRKREQRIQQIIPVAPRRARWEIEDRRRKVYLRSKVWQFFKLGLHPKSAARLVGCDLVFFRSWIEAQLTGRMTMANYGRVWELDHVKPCCHFDLADPVQRAACFHYTNYQPLLSKQNRQKSGKLNYAAQMPLMLGIFSR